MASQLTPFELLKITTMTLVISLTGKINIANLFALMPITSIDLPIKKRELKKSKLPHHPVAGSILSMRYDGNIRGVMRGAGQSFKNAVTIDMSVSAKNLSLKVSNSKIQMCGASSVEQAREGCELLIKQVIEVNDEIKYVQENIHNTSEIINLLLENCQGPSLQNDESSKSIDDTDGDEKFMVVLPGDEIIRQMSDIDERILSFLLSFAWEFSSFNDFALFLKWVTTSEVISSDDLAIETINKAMVNYNYALGYEINRYKLYECMNGRNGFIASFDSLSDCHCSIHLPLKDTNIQRRGSKIPQISFMVYKSGRVTLSSNGSQATKDAYELFMSTIQEIKELIICN
jgi:hypothetical protein